MNLSVIVPVFNEAGNVGPFISLVREVIGPENELIVVDDGSTDGTKDEIDTGKCKVLQHEVNRGKGAAMRSGIEDATRDVIMFIGGDGQDDPREIPDLFAAIEKGADFVIGSRFLPAPELDLDGGDQQVRFTRDAVRPVNRLGNQVLTIIIRTLFGVAATDSQAEFKCIRADKLRALALQSDRYEIETEMLIKAARDGLKIVEVPVHRYPRKHGSSKLYGMPLGRLKFGWRVLKTMVEGILVWR